MNVGVKIVALVISLLFISLLSLSMTTANAQETYYILDKQITPASFFVGSEENISIKISISVPDKLRADVVFAIDSSESMKLNDPEGIRVTSVENFIEKMDLNDRAGLVSWDHDIDFSVALTNDFEEIKEKAREVDEEGGTNLNVGLRESISILKSDPRGEVIPVIIFLTDGVGDYFPVGGPSSPVAEAIEKRYIIYTVGLGDRIDELILREIANATGGKYFYASNASTLIPIFEEISEEIIKIYPPKEVVLTDVLPDYLTLVGNFSVSPSVSPWNNPDGTTMLVWEIGDMKTGETWYASFEVRCNISELSMDAYAHEDSRVDYVDHEGKRKKELIPNRKIGTKCVKGEEERRGIGVIGESEEFSGEVIKGAAYVGCGLAGGAGLAYYLLRRKRW